MESKSGPEQAPEPAFSSAGAENTLTRGTFLRRAGVVAAAVAAPGALGTAKRAAAAASRSSRGVTINYMVAAGSPFSEIVQKMIAPDFTKHTGIKVNIIELPYQNTFTKAVLEARNKTGAYDVIQMNRPTLAAFVKPNYLMPLDDYVSESTFKDLFPVHKSYVTFNNHKYAIPHSNDLRALYYRKDVFRAAGLDVPTNWKQMEAAAKRLTRGRQFGLILAGSSTGPGVWVLADFIHQNGGEILTADGKAAVDKAPAVEALDFFVRLLKKDKVLPPGTPNYLWTDTRTLFPEGLGAMVQEFNDIIPLLDDPKNSKVVGKYDLALLPGNVRRGTNNAGWLVGIPAGAKHPKEAGQLIEFLVSKKAQTAMCQQSGTLSGRRSIIDALIKSGKPNRPKGDPFGKTRWEFYKEVVATTYELPRTPAEPAIETILGQALSNALSQQQTPQAAMTAAAKAINKL